MSRKSVKFINRNGLKLPGTFIRGTFIGNQTLWLKNIYEMFMLYFNFVTVIKGKFPLSKWVLI